jgi:multiple sugar transport system permease protein
MATIKTKFRYKDAVAGYLFIAPPILGFLLFGMIPIVFSAVVSFSSFDFFTKEMAFVGFANYARIFQDALFAKAMGNIGFAVLGLFVQIGVTLLIALLLTVKIKGSIAFRVLFFIPSLCSSVAVTMVWKWVYNYDFGILNTVLNVFGLPKIGWLTSTRVAMTSMVLQGIWMGIGGGMVMYIAALKNVPVQYYEAAKIDGANAFQRFFRITFPMISPTTFYILVTSMIGTMQDFTRFSLMANGGPNYATLTPVLYIYQTAFTSGFDYDYSYATAMSWVIGVIILVLVGGIFATSKRWVHYND